MGLLTPLVYLPLPHSRQRLSAFLIGSYTFAKTLEYKAKQGLNSGKEVTVIPPAEYQERFVNALDGYFLACPGNVFSKLERALVAHSVGVR